MRVMFTRKRGLTLIFCATGSRRPQQQNSKFCPRSFFVRILKITSGQTDKKHKSKLKKLKKMKKLFFALVCALFTINVFAAGPECKVSGENTTVQLTLTSGTADDNGKITIYVNASAALGVTANIMVDVYDAKNNYFDTIVITITKSNRYGNGTVSGLTPGKAYWFQIRQAVSCD